MEMSIEDRLQTAADELTADIMSHVFGSRFNDTDDITEDKEMSMAWEYINEKTFGYLWSMYDAGFADGEEETEKGLKVYSNVIKKK